MKARGKTIVSALRGRGTALLVALVGSVGLGGFVSAAPAGAARAHTLPGKGKPAVVLGDKNFAEEYILGDLYQQALQAQGYTVKVKANLGSTELAWKALKAGQIQGYPEYDGTLLATIAGISKNAKNAAAEGIATDKWLKRRGYTFTKITPFTDADAIVVTKAYADAHKLKTIGDLGKLGAAVKLGGAPEFGTRYPDGMPGLEKIYRIHPTFDPLNIGSFYTALSNGEIDAAVGFTTDPPLSTGKYVALKDPKFIFGFQNVGMVLKASVAKAEGPAFTQTINRVSRLLTQKAIIRLDSAVEVDKLSAAKVAKEFLRANHLA